MKRKIKIPRRYHCMNSDQRRNERLRRLPLLLKAFRDMQPRDVRQLVAAALLCDAEGPAAKEVLG